MRERGLGWPEKTTSHTHWSSRPTLPTAGRNFQNKPSILLNPVWSAPRWYGTWLGLIATLAGSPFLVIGFMTKSGSRGFPGEVARLRCGAAASPWKTFTSWASRTLDCPGSLKASPVEAVTQVSGKARGLSPPASGTTGRPSFFSHAQVKQPTNLNFAQV